MLAVAFQRCFILDIAPGQQFLVASLVVDILVLGLVTLGVVVTDQTVVEADSAVVPPAPELEVRVGAGHTVLTRSLTTLVDSKIKIWIRKKYFQIDP